MLTVYIDFKSPASYLAMKPVLELVQRCELKLVWKPFKTVERDVPKLAEKASVAETHRQVRAASRRAIHQKYANIQGIDLQFPSRLADTDLALSALAAIKGDPLAFIKFAFNAYWQEHSDLNDWQVVGELLDRSGFQLEKFQKNDLLVLLKSEQAKAEDLGVVEAPAFFIKDQLFIGREHLPWIDELARN